MTLQIIWFVLWGVLWAVYFVLDGFDLGAGRSVRLPGRDEEDKSAGAAAARSARSGTATKSGF